MKKFNVIVNGVAYDVAVEEIKAGQTVTPAAAPAPTPAAPAAAPAVSATAGAGAKITSPMPGNIWKVLVKEGQSVKEGDVVVILEAMKMENEIYAPCDGVVTSMLVVEGGTVDTDAVICTIG